jgi:glycosyltransferase involved in cell wall biosynthesis
VPLQVLIKSNFQANALGHGGNRRAYQIHWLLSDSNKIIYFLDNQPKESFTNKCLFVIALLPKLFWKLGRNRQFYNTNFISILYVALQLNRTFKNNRIDLVIWESTLPSEWYFPYLCRYIFHKKVYAFPHNLESVIATNKIEFRSSINNLNNELNYLDACHHVFTISFEENWLFNNLGMNASLLPYFPVGQIADNLNTVKNSRSQRLPNDRKQYLILGTVLNTPTHVGMLELIQELQKEKYKHLDITFCIAGFGTNSFRNEIFVDYIICKGELLEEELQLELIHTDGAIVYQPTSTGALTKIAEYTYMNIPVLCNIQSARTIQQLQHVFVYSSFEQLFQILTNSSASLDVQELDVAYYQNLVKDQLVS